MEKRQLIPFLLCALVILPACGPKKTEEKNKKVVKKDHRQKGSGIPTSNNGDEGKYFDEQVESFALNEDADGVLVEGKDEATSWTTAKNNSLACEPIFFGFDKHEIEASEQPVLACDIERVKELVEKDVVAIVVEGIADSYFVSKTYNIAKSQLRAEVVKKELVDAGIASSNIKTIGYGDAKKLVDVSGKERKNRRAEIIEVIAA